MGMQIERGDAALLSWRASLVVISEKYLCDKVIPQVVQFDLCVKYIAEIFLLSIASPLLVPTYRSNAAAASKEDR